MRILHVIQELGVGGAERVLASLVAGAIQAGDEVAVAAAPGAVSAELRCEQFRLPVLQRRLERVPLAVWRLMHVIRMWRPTIVHCHNPGMGFVAALATVRGRRTPAIVSVHGLPEEDYRAGAHVLRWAGLPVVACGPGVAAALSDHGVRVWRTIVNGVSPAPPPADRGALMREWRISDRQLVVSVGRLVPQKNQALAIHAMAGVPEAALVILGEGPLRADLAETARRAGLGDRVVLAGSRPDARGAMGAADAVVISSRWEGMPLVALEALTARTPVVATAVRGIREFLHDEVDCLMVPAEDPQALAHALQRVLNDMELARRLTDNGARLAAANTEVEMVRRFHATYREVVGWRSSR